MHQEVAESPEELGAGLWRIYGTLDVLRVDDTAREYVALTRRYQAEIGSMDWAAPMDWMCEPFILEKTRSTVASHQRRTVRNYVGLMEMAPDVPWIPVLQGWHPSDYLRCIDLYAQYRIDLTKLPLVGVGSICRRQGEVRIALLLEQLAGCGLKLHGFGIKLKGLELAVTLSIPLIQWLGPSHSLTGCQTQCGSRRCTRTVPTVTSSLRTGGTVWQCSLKERPEWPDRPCAKCRQVFSPPRKLEVYCRECRREYDKHYQTQESRPPGAHERLRVIAELSKHVWPENQKGKFHRLKKINAYAVTAPATEEERQ